MQYLGKKGYTVYKSTLSHDQIEKIKLELTARPISGLQKQSFLRNSNSYNRLCNVLCGDPQSFKTFPVYRESANKLYLPRFYGMKKFGKCEMKNDVSKDININFLGALRDNQVPVVDAYMKNLCNGGGLLELECAYGKTVIALNIISRIKKKTLVIVHKEFLLNQWIERIEQFLPDAKVGIIQGSTIDIEDKDIVIGMLQSLSMKVFHEDQFTSFGLTIVDECHHISSEVFSCSLFHIVTKYVMGLSATMERKDGTSYIIKMFLGDVVFKGVNPAQHKVVVRGISAIEKTNDEYNQLLTDFKGNVQYSKMITKLCNYIPRSNFILELLRSMLKEEPSQQIMVLAHNKSILKYLYESIDFATKGYYIGGMKQAALQDSETKQIIIATFSMASEALDIKTLTTLVMATPKTDIEQCVGRILRQKNAVDPLIIDIIDEHNPFRNQWLKRKQFYKSKGYTIVESAFHITDCNKRDDGLRPEC